MLTNVISCSITKVPLVSGGKDVLVYTTIAGAIGALIPFQTKDDIEFMSTLEMVSTTIVASSRKISSDIILSSAHADYRRIIDRS